MRGRTSVLQGRSPSDHLPSRFQGAKPEFITERSRRRFSLVDEFPAIVLPEVFHDRIEEVRTKAFELLFAYPADVAQLPLVGGILARHLAERDIPKDDVGRNAEAVRDLPPQIAQRVEQRLVARDFAGGFVAGTRGFVALLAAFGQTSEEDALAG